MKNYNIVLRVKIEESNIEDLYDGRLYREMFGQQ